jgi:predicted metal-dependent enzyme (double-stranded beta helix superfamily)
MDWQSFLRRLDREIDWDVHDPDDVRTLEELVCELAADRDVIADAVAQLASNDEMFFDYLPHVEYPRPFMDKFLLHMDRDDRFRVRVHSFRFGSPVGIGRAAPTIHDHRWNFTTYVLSGSYVETVYRFETNDPAPTAIDSRRLSAGHVRSLASGVLHQTVNDSTHAECLTLFVRGKSRRDISRVWDPEAGAFRILMGRGEQVRAELTRIGMKIGMDTHRAGETETAASSAV